MSGDPNWRAAPLGDGLANAINDLIAQGRIGGVAGTLVPTVDPLDWRSASSKVGDGLCNRINLLIAQGLISTIPSSVTVGAPVGTPNWRSATDRSGSGLADYINLEIALGRIVGGQLLDIAWPTTPTIWYSANNINGSFNVGIADNDPQALWKNLGNIASPSAWDAAQVTAGNKPLFKAVAFSGKMNNKPCVRFDGADDYMISTVNSIQAQPATWVVVGRQNDAGTRVWFSGSTTNRNQMFCVTGNPEFFLYAGGSADSSFALIPSTFHTLVGLFNGAASVATKDASSSGAINASTAGIDQMLIGAGPPAPGTPLLGDIFQIAGWFGGGQPTAAQIVAAVTAHYGATPQ